VFGDILRGNFLTVIKGKDILTAHKWGGFIRWVGGIRPPEVRNITRKKNGKKLNY
jgi:hypothetical protein